MLLTTTLTFLLLQNVHCLATPGKFPIPAKRSDSSNHSSSEKVKTIHSFQLGTWVENLLVRPSGKVLATVYTPSPEIFEIDPQSGRTTLVATLPDSANLLGIAEGPTNGTVYVIGEDFPVSTLQGKKGTNIIYEVDLHKFDASSGVRKADVNLALRVPNATALNGLAPVNAATGIYVSTDFGDGSIYLLDLVSGQAEVIVDNNWTAKLPGAVGGADGIKVRDGHVYWTTFGAKVFARVPIDARGKPTGPPEKLADVFSDDLCFGPAGEAYLTMPGQNAIGIWRAGQTTVSPLPGVIYGPTAVQLGLDATSLIVTTSGNDTQYPIQVTRPGRVVKLSL